MTRFKTQHLSFETLEARCLLTGLVAAYGLAEGAGTSIADSSGNGNTGIISGATWTSGGIYGNALSFNGTDASVSIPDSASLDLTNGMTLEAWVKPSAPASGQSAIVAKEQTNDPFNVVAYALYSADGSGNAPSVHGTFNYRGQNYGQSATGAASLPTNTWSYVAGTFDGAMLRLYVNGQLAGSRIVTFNAPLTTTTAPLRIGGDFANEFFAGLIDEVRVYNRALSQVEIQTDMNTPVDGNRAAISDPITGARVWNTIPISADASAGAGIASVQFQLDGVNLGPALTTAPYTSSWDTTGVANGAHTLTAIASDTTGNTITSAAVTVTVSNDNNNGPLLIYHHVQTDAGENIAPWFSSDPGTAYDHDLGMVWNYWKNLPNDDNGYGKPEYYSVRYLIGGGNLGIGGDQFAMAIDSWIHYYQYSGDHAVLQNAIDIADFYLASALTPSSYVYGSLPYPCNTTNDGSGLLVYDGDLEAGPGVLQPDKAGSFGEALVSLYKVTGNPAYLTAAVNIANTLASTVNFGADQDNSPWPFRVVAETGAQPDQPGLFTAYTTNYGPTLSLFQSLIGMNQGNVPAYYRVFNSVLFWMKLYPMMNNQWGPFFEDHSQYSNTEINADTWAYYLLRNPSWDANWQQDVPGILNWVQSPDGFGDTGWNSISWADYGVTVIDEQTVYPVPGNSHTARHASTELTYDALSGNTANTAAAIRQLNWATYMVNDDGANQYPDNAIWLTDGYGDYVRHYLRAMAADPALAPYNQSHLLSTSSYVTGIQYETGNITYTTADYNAQDTLRLAFIPSVVKEGDVSLPRLTSIAQLQYQDGYTFNAPGDPAGVLRIHHSQSASVLIAAATGPGGPSGPFAPSKQSGGTSSNPAITSVSTSQFVIAEMVHKVVPRGSPCDRILVDRGVGPVSSGQGAVLQPRPFAGADVLWIRDAMSAPDGSTPHQVKPVRRSRISTAFFWSDGIGWSSIAPATISSGSSASGSEKPLNS
jgi:hypothetical protein